jgi:nicotinamide-nucleotide amidase
MNSAASSSAALAAEVISLAIEAKVSLATAESITGGLIAAALSSVPGASKVLLGSVVSYSDAVKTQWLGVSPQLIANQTAVDAEVAAQMAEGLRDRMLRVTPSVSLVTLSATGVAGPEPVGQNAVGSVFLGLATQATVQVYAEAFDGDRESIREQTLVRGLEILREHLSGR